MATTRAGLVAITMTLIHALDSGSFPALTNLARQSQVYTQPDVANCGYASPSAFCRSWPSPDSVVSCVQEVCNMSCPYGTVGSQYNSYVDLLDARVYGNCTVHKNNSSSSSSRGIEPKTYGNSNSTLVSFGQGCYLETLSEISTADIPSFTLTLWLLQAAGNYGTLLQQPATATTKTSVQIAMNQTHLQLMYSNGTSKGQVTFQGSLILNNTWTFLTLQVYDRTVSLFVNGTSAGTTAFMTSPLDGRLSIFRGPVILGQDVLKSNNQFVGIIKDFRFYSVALSNREIDQVYSGMLPETYLQSECLCPSSYPRISPLSQRYCVRNGDYTASNQIRRLNDFAHPLGYLNDGDPSSAWVSTPLNSLDLVVDLGDVFQVFYIIVQFYSPLPESVAIQRRATNSSSWVDWQLYAVNCSAAFGMENNAPLATATSVNCLQLGTNGLTLPYSMGNITFAVLSAKPIARPGYNNFYGTPALNDFVAVSQVHLSFRGHSYSGNSSQHNYYGIYELFVTGRCDCHGHGDYCDITALPYQCHCMQDSHTEGTHCSTCQALYNDKPFRNGDQASAYNCKPCQCYNHSQSCIYNSTVDPYPDDYYRGGGGVCVACMHNTTGRNCDRCLPLHYRLVQAGNESSLYDDCQPCDCDPKGSVGGASAQCTDSGQCPCKVNVGGQQCSHCVANHYNLDAENPFGCQQCNCNSSDTAYYDIKISACNCSVTGANYTLEVQQSVINIRSLTLRWSPSVVPSTILTHLVSYTICADGPFYADPGNGNYTLVSSRVCVYMNGTYNGTWVIVGPLLPFAQYSVMVNTSTSTNSWTVSKTSFITTLPSGPDGVKAPAVLNVSLTSVTLAWNLSSIGRVNSANMPVFQIQSRLASLSAPLALTEAAFANFSLDMLCTKTNLTPCTEYLFQLVVSSGYGQTPSDWVSVQTLCGDTTAAINTSQYFLTAPMSREVAAPPVYVQPWFIGVVIAFSLVVAAAIIVTSVVRCLKPKSGSSSLHANLNAAKSLPFSYDPLAELSGMSTVTYNDSTSYTPSRVSLKEALLAQGYINAAFPHLPSSQQFAASAGPTHSLATRAASKSTASSRSSSRPSRRHFIDCSDDSSSSSSEASRPAASQTSRCSSQREGGEAAGKPTWESHIPDSGVYDSDQEKDADSNSSCSVSSVGTTADMVDTHV